MRRKVLFLCTHNSARSQMAEGLLRHLAGETHEVDSAGSLATEVRAEAAQVMGEIGIDLTAHRSKTLDRFLHQPLDLVVTVCDHARDVCPTFHKVVDRLHWSIPDPASVSGSDEDKLEAFRKARIELEARIRDEILPPDGDVARNEHYRKLEQMYLSAPTNAYYRPGIEIQKGVARVTLEARPEFHHAGGAVHGSVYFKALDDACFFAANSESPSSMVLTSQFNIHLVGAVSEGVLSAVGRVVHAGRSSFLAEGRLADGNGCLLARGEGTFVKSRTALDATMGYHLP